ncbi:MAG: DUF2752 domain-containing protein [Ignavibacteria bacterium]|nr:DUF2752 domain-containing protein [Ignavibacteria bacterium]
MISIHHNIIEENKIVKLFNSKLKKIWSLIGFEAFVWILSLFYLIFIHYPGETHFTICPFANLGIEFCPGCGLGNSISYIFTGNFVESFQSHPLGIFALIIIIFRIVTIINNNRRRYA